MLDRSLKRPDARSFLARLIENYVHQRLACLGIYFTENQRRDFDQVALEFALVPLFENVGKLRRLHAQDVLQNSVSFTNQLDITVLDTVVHHLHVMTGAIRSHVSTAGFAIDLRSDLAKDRGDDFP